MKTQPKNPYVRLAGDIGGRDLVIDFGTCKFPLLEAEPGQIDHCERLVANGALAALPSMYEIRGNRARLWPAPDREYAVEFA